MIGLPRCLKKDHMTTIYIDISNCISIVCNPKVDFRISIVTGTKASILSFEVAEYTDRLELSLEE